MGRFLILLIIVTFIGTIIYFGCHHDDRVIDAGFEERNNSKPSANSFEGCYRLIVDKDTAFMQLTKISDCVYDGRLSYHKLYIKKTTKKIGIDSTKGPVRVYCAKPYLKGYFKVNNDSIHAREIIFKIDGMDLVEGYGLTILRNDSIVFKRPANLEYDMANPFKKVNCNQ